jgi:Zn-dependent protease with chaperone function
MRLILLLTCFLFILYGCVPAPKPNLEPISPEIQTVIKNLSWVQLILVIGIVGSIFACFNGAAKIGIPLLISSLIGYGLTSAMLFYAKIIAILSLVGGISLCAYMIFIKNRALKELIKGVQEVKNTMHESEKANVNLVLQGSQSPTTEKIVKKIKKK